MNGEKYVYAWDREFIHNGCWDKYKTAHIPRERLLNGQSTSNNSQTTLTEVHNVNKKKQSLVFSTTYSVEFRKMVAIIEKNVPILHSDLAVSQVLSDGYNCVAKKAPTIGNILSSSLLFSKLDNEPTWLKYIGCFRANTWDVYVVNFYMCQKTLFP